MTSFSILLAVMVFVGVFVAIFLLLPKAQSGQYTKKALDRIYQESEGTLAPEGMSLRGYGDELAGLDRALLSFPGGQKTYELLLKAATPLNISAFYLLNFVLFALVFMVINPVGFPAVITMPLCAWFAYWAPRAYLRHRIEKRNETFINMFPDALDMIVRSVRSGHPLNTAIKMIAENMDPPVSTEFQLVVDEIAYGRSLTDALIRLSQRIDQPDIQFFVVVLSVQQETGGNLAEVMSNLSNIIRKRKQLRLKIKAMTSEGRATAWILTALPIVEMLAIYMTSPHYLEPLRHTMMGKIIVVIAIGMILLANLIVRKMIKIDI